MKVAITSRNAQGNSINALLNNGTLRFYSGTEPATPETALSGNTLLAQLTLGATAFAAASAGAIAANAIGQDVSADATGTATFWRMLASDGTTVHLQGTVNTSGADINVNSTAFQSGATVSCSAFTWTIPQ
jgi:hypothetical protein